MTVQKMLRLADNLPEFDDSQFWGEVEIVARYKSLNSKLEGAGENLLQKFLICTETPKG